MVGLDPSQDVRGRIRSLEVILTAACNLRCGYCYQNAKQARRMSWETLQPALDLVLRSEHPALAVRFIGGEPLLEMPLIRRAVEYLGSRAGPANRIEYALSTNGTLVDRDISAFLQRHDFETQLSFDGVPAAQDIRGRGTFARLDALLDEMRVEFPNFFHRRLHVAMALYSGNLRHLGDSVAYFLNKGIARIRIGPLLTHDEDWRIEDIGELDRQFARVFDLSLAHYQRSGQVPVEVFRRHHAADLHHPVADEMCGVSRGEGITIDVDGQVTGCVTFAESYQRIASDFLKSRLDAMRMGPLQGPRFSERLALYPEAAARAGLFHNKRSKHSSYRRCGECEYVAECSVCPVSIGHIPGNRDPDRVPDLSCAYNLVAHKYRALFPAQPTALDIVKGRGFVPASVQKILAAASLRPGD
jgi:sulfatase maturation enzyme AslB (radical SAM superfamily)